MNKTMIKPSHKRKLTRAKNKLIDIAKYRKEDNDFSDALSYLLSGKETLTVSYIEFGERNELTYDVPDMLDELSFRRYISMHEFIRDHSQENFNQLLNQYFIYTLYYIVAAKKGKEIRRYDTDITFILLLSMMYYDDAFQGLLVDTLQYYKINRAKRNSNADGASLFSIQTLLPLAYHFYQQREGNKPWSMTLDNVSSEIMPKTVSENIMENITPLYKKAIDNIYTEDLALLQENISEMGEYHFDRMKDNFEHEFRNEEWQYFPVDMLFLLKERHEKGHSIEGINHPLIDDFLPFFLNPFVLSEESKAICHSVKDPKSTNEEKIDE